MTITFSGVKVTGGLSIQSVPAAAGTLMTYSIGTAGSGGSATANGSAGGTTTVTLNNSTITANGGGGGVFNPATSPIVLLSGLGGTASGGDVNVTGGKGFSQTSGDKGGGGGGGIGTANAVAPSLTSYGGNGAQSLDVSGLFSILTSLGVANVSPGTGGNSQNGPGKFGTAATGFGCGGGGTGYYGGAGANGLYGGGGGGASGGPVEAGNGGSGGQGAVVIAFTNGPNAGVMLTTGTSYTIPAGVTQVKIWAVGAGGGGAGCAAVSDNTNGGAGGAGGVAVKTFTL